MWSLGNCKCLWRQTRDCPMPDTAGYNSPTKGHRWAHQPPSSVGKHIEEGSQNATEKRGQKEQREDEEFKEGKKQRHQGQRRIKRRYWENQQSRYSNPLCRVRRKEQLRETCPDLFLRCQLLKGLSVTCADNKVGGDLSGVETSLRREEHCIFLKCLYCLLPNIWISTWIVRLIVNKFT